MHRRVWLAAALLGGALVLLALSPIGAARAEAPPVPLYTGVADQNITIRVEKNREAEGVGQLQKGDRAYILEYDPGWLTVVQQKGDAWVTGYVLRHTVFDIEAIAGGVPPYGTTPAVYSGVLGKDTDLLAAPMEGALCLKTMTAGTRLAILRIEDGWAEVIHWRQYGYFRLEDIAELTPIYDVQTAGTGDMIAAFISFFSLSEKGLNPNRILNIGLACEFISIPLAPGESFSFNEIAGPYRKTRGYLEAPSFVGGETVPSYGGGTCQVSSTLYNALLPLKDQDITILYRVAHGAGGAAYLPHGVDAACGNERIDLKFRNDFAFPIRIEASAHDGVLHIAIRKDG